MTISDCGGLWFNSFFFFFSYVLAFKKEKNSVVNMLGMEVNIKIEIRVTFEDEGGE